MRLRRISEVALAGLAGAVLGWLIHIEVPDEPRSRPETLARPASRPGDAKPRLRVTEPPTDRVEPVEPVTHEETQDSSPDEPERPEPPQRVLRIVDGDGSPVPNLYVAIKSPIDSRRWTNAEGEALVDRTDAPTSVEFSDGRTTRAVELRDDTTQVVVDALPKLELSVVDAKTGLALDPVRCSLRRVEGEQHELWTGRDRATLAAEAFYVSVEPPAGYAGFRENFWTGDLASRAKRVRYVVPLFEATERTLLVRLPGGKPAKGAKVEDASLSDRPTADWYDGTNVTWKAEPSGADGLIRVHGLPRIPFTRLRVEVLWTGDVDGERTQLAALASEIDLNVPEPEEPIVAVLGDRLEYHGPSSASGCGPADRYDGPTAALAVRVSYADGTPARQVRVLAPGDSLWTDADGRASFPALPVGATDLVALVHGFVPTIVQVDVGSVASIEITEAAARDVRIVVTDEEAHPLPSARVTAQCCFLPNAAGKDVWAACTLAQLDGDIETIAPLTDRLGAAVLHAPRGKIQYTVSLGDAIQRITTDADEVTVVLSDPHD